MLKGKKHSPGGVKKLYLKVLQNSQKKCCVGVSFFNNVAGLRPANLLQKRLGHKCFPVNFAKFLKITFL